MKHIATLALLLIIGMLFISCEKEYSYEGGEGMATGTLKAAGTGECLPSNIGGIFTANKILTANNFIDVTVNFTTIGAYIITTKAVNGYSFSGTGFATATGDQTIRLKGTGTPAAVGANTFTVRFGSSECNIVVDVSAAGTGNASFTVACSDVVLGGSFKQNLAMTAANTATIDVLVSVAGTYDITTDTQNGVSFHGSGSFTATGIQTVTLTATGKPTASGLKTYLVSSGTNACNFDVNYAAITGTNPWSFKVGSTTYSGITGIASIGNNPPFASLVGISTAGGEFHLSFGTTNSSIGVGIYPGTFSSPGNYCSQFHYIEGSTKYNFQSTIEGNISTIVTEYNTTTRIIEGTFSGTARFGDPATLVNILDGKFKAALP